MAWCRGSWGGRRHDRGLPGNAPRRTRQAQEESGKNPVLQCSLTLGQERVGEIIKGASAAVAPVTLQSGPVVVGAPGHNGGALAPETGQRTLLPPPGMERGVAGVGVAEVVEV